MPVDLITQAEQLADQYEPGNEARHVLEAVIAGVRSGAIPDATMEAAMKMRDDLPGSTISLMLQKLITGSKNAITQKSLLQWIEVTERESGTATPDRPYYKGPSKPPGD